jgi:hypothetical protein
MPDAVDTSVGLDQQPFAEALLDPARGNPRGEKLSPRNDAVLPTRNRGNDSIWTTHTGV